MMLHSQSYIKDRSRFAVNPKAILKEVKLSAIYALTAHHENYLLAWRGRVTTLRRQAKFLFRCSPDALP